MNRIIEQAKSLTKRAFRPVARWGRWILEPVSPPLLFQFCRIEAGPACDCRLLLPTPSAIADLITSGNYEKKTTEVLSGLVRRDDNCVDIGGHYGFYTALLAKLALDGSVQTFEPVERLANSIRHSIRESGWEHAQVCQSAVAERPGELLFRFAGSGVGDDSMGYLADYGGMATPQSLEQYSQFTETAVPVTSIDAMAVRPDFIKIDAEGAESAILRGAISTLGSNRPRLLIELHGIREALRCTHFLRLQNYMGFCIEDRSETMISIWLHREDRDALCTLSRLNVATPDRSLIEDQP